MLNELLLNSMEGGLEISVHTIANGARSSSVIDKKCSEVVVTPSS